MTPGEFQNRLDNASKELRKRIEKQLAISSLRMEGRSKQVTFSQFKNRTGRLRQSIAGRVISIDGRPTAVLQAGGQFGGVELNYADDIENGTSRIRPRLFLSRSVKKEQDIIAPKLDQILREALRS